MPYAVDEEYEPTEQFVLVDEGIYPASIFAVEKKQKETSDGHQRWYEITFRINGGPFDGEDVKATYVGLKGKSLFRIYDILKALREIGAYYNAEQKRWFALPAPEDIEGKALYVKVEHEEFQSKKDGVLQFNDDGTPKMLKSAKAEAFFDIQQPAPEFKRTRKAVADVPQPTAQAVAAQAAAGGAAQGELPW